MFRRRNVSRMETMQLHAGAPNEDEDVSELPMSDLLLEMQRPPMALTIDGREAAILLMNTMQRDVQNMNLFASEPRNRTVSTYQVNLVQLRQLTSGLFEMDEERRFEDDMKAAMDESVSIAVHQLPVVEWRDEPYECPLCLDTVEVGTRVRQLGCKHHFHTECIDRWLCQEQSGKRRRCPLCNADPITGIVPDPFEELRANPRWNPSAAPRHRSTDARTAATAEPTGLLFGGLPVEELLPRWVFLSWPPAEDIGEQRPAATGNDRSLGLQRGQEVHESTYSA